MHSMASLSAPRVPPTTQFSTSLYQNNKSGEYIENVKSGGMGSLLKYSNTHNIMHILLQHDQCLLESYTYTLSQASCPRTCA